MKHSVEPVQYGTPAILIVDDEQPIRKLLQRILQSQSFITFAAGDGYEAIKCLESNDFDVVITDISMPNMDGLELTDQIIKRFSSDVIAVTGQVDKYHYEELIRLGASDFIQKPINPDEIVLRVKRVLKERMLKQDLIRYHKELAQAQKFESIGLLAAGIAHEINTPIQYIGDNTVFMQESFDDIFHLTEKFTSFFDACKQGQINDKLLDEMQETIDEADFEYLSEEIPVAVEQTLDGVNRVRKIVQSMKEFSHPGTSEKAMVDIHHIIENSVTVTINQWKYCADLKLDFDDNMPQIRCDASEISQVMVNLIINASHAIIEKNGKNAAEKGLIKISTQKKDPWAQIRITDTGTGIPKDICEKVFDPFFTTKEVGQGTGQGLAISRTVIVERHHGRLEIESKSGDGTSFIIKLPLE